MPIRTLIVDDEPLARARLSRLLGQLSGVEVVGCAEDGQQAVAQFGELQPELIFMDIQMPILNGIDAAKRIMETATSPPSIIFCTAYDSYALEAFKLHASSYLLKPVSFTDLEEAVNVAQRLTQLQVAAVAEYKEDQDMIVLGDSSASQRLNVDQICYFRSEQKQVLAGLRNHSEMLVEFTLSELESMYSDMFLRLHRSTLVNRDKLKRLVRSSTQGIVVELHDSEKVFSVSRRLVQNVRKEFSNR